ncbi:MAG: LacI family DNA-binding transcriptional regulator [Ruminiclostridium sp.]
MKEIDVNKKVTIKEIAYQLGISFSTVSKSLNNHPAVKEETRRIVLKKAEELGYSPNILARGLRTHSTQTIGVVFNDIENPVLTYIFKNISIKMAEYGYTTLICDSQFSAKAERANILSVLSRSPDFVIVAPATNEKDNLDLLLSNTNQVIVLDESSPERNCNFIHVDYKYGGYLSACELLSKGHRNILVITDPLTYPYAANYIDGVKKAFSEYSVPFRPEYLQITDSTAPKTAKVASIILSYWNKDEKRFSLPFSAVMTFDDNFAMGVYQAASQLGLSIPDDLSVIGFDDNAMSAFASPPLTTVHLPKERISESCIEILNSHLISSKSSNSIYTLTPFLVNRDSVKQIY